MNHNDHVDLLRDGIPQPGGVWADFGAGSGAFTLALAELILPGGVIFAVDRNANALSYLEAVFRDRPADQKPVLNFLLADFTSWLDLPPLDGVVMANALHFHKNKEAVLEKIFIYLKPGAHFILVEYNVEHGNPWVPYPISYPKWASLASYCGFVNTRMLAIKPSRFLKEIYSALSLKPASG